MGGFFLSAAGKRYTSAGSLNSASASRGLSWCRRQYVAATTLAVRGRSYIATLLRKRACNERLQPQPQQQILHGVPR